MWKRLIALLLALIMPLGCIAEEAEGPTAELDEELRKIFRRYGTVGGVIVVAKEGEIVYHYDYGYSDKKEKTPVTPETYFRTASVTKMVTAVRLMQLVDEGLLDLDAPLGQYLGYPVRHPRFKTDVSLRMLMSHTASMYGTLPSGWTMERLVKRQKTWQDWKPGTKYRYSNFAGTISSIIEAATGQEVNGSVHDHVFKPLGIDGGYRVPLLKEPLKASNVYTEEGKMATSLKSYLKVEWCGQADPENHCGVGVGSLWMRGDDLCRVGMMLCAGGTLDGVTILSEEAVAEMTSSQEGKGGVTVDSPYALCVHRADSLLKERLVYGHQGQSEGIVCNLYWEPESQMVFALISNGSNRILDDYIVSLSRRAFSAVWREYGDPNVEVTRY